MIILPVAVMLVLAAYFLFLQKRSRLRPGLARDFNYILISVDTLRADRVGCYGFTYVETPTMDLFARRGVKFDDCTAVTPLTLPSHTSLLTGTYPTFHGVRDNGGFLVPQQIETLAEIMLKNGYQTSAFVAAYVLDSKWGLNQGFDFYFDRFDLSKFKTISLGQVQRPGHEVIEEVIPWLDEHKDEKFFTWIHLYDPHTPYEPPPPYDSLYPNRPYLGEIAYTDSQLARVWQYLEENNLVDNTVLVFVADHGESLGEHEESTHGFFIYQEGVHVPLIFITPFSELQGLSRASAVSLVDVMPTILDLAGIAIPSQVQGRSLLSLFSHEQPDSHSIAYSETYYPRFHYGWSELKSLQDGRYKLIMAPELELYDLQNDPDESQNLVDVQAGEARRLMRDLEAFIEESSQNAYELDYSNMDEDTRAKLAALGYIGTFTDSSSLSGRQLGDPKEKIVVFNRLGEARELGLQERFEEAVQIIKEITTSDPDVIDAYFTLGNLYFKWGKLQEALESFQHVLNMKPDDAFTVINIANSYIRMNKLEQAENFLQSQVEKLSPDSQVFFIMGNIYNAQKKYDQAIVYYKKCMDLNPASASAYNALGGIYVIQGEHEEAERYLGKAIELNPKLRDLHYNYAQLQEAKGDLRAAVSAYLQELENIPHNFRASFNLSRLYRIQGKVAEEQKLLEKTIENNPNFPLSYFYLARIFLNRKEKYQDALALVKKGIELKPEQQNLPLGYFLMADLYNRLGDNAKSAEFARKGEQARSEIKK